MLFGGGWILGDATLGCESKSVIVFQVSVGVSGDKTEGSSALGSSVKWGVVRDESNVARGASIRT